MNKIISLALIFSLIQVELYTQEIVHLPLGEVPSSLSWDNEEKQYHSNIWLTEVVTNVSKPSMRVFRPAEGQSNGTAVIICPGGGLYALSIESEGNQVAQWLADRGVTAFVLRYRLVPTGDDGVKDISTAGGPVVMKKAGEVLPIATRDGLNAIQHVRTNAETYGVRKDRIGIMGFSAGGAVTMNATYNYNAENRPDFIGPVYAWMDVVPSQDPPSDAPPMFVLCAGDDPLNLAPASVKLYSQWLEKGINTELHMYSKGGHGFGMRQQNLPSDHWIERFGEWLSVSGWMPDVAD